MKIIIANPYFPPFAPGGAEHSLEQMCLHFAKAGLDVYVITNCYDGNPGIREHEGYTIEYVESPIQLKPGQQVDAFDYVFSNAYHKKLLNVLLSNAQKADLSTVFIANNAPCYIPVVQAGMDSNIPTIGIIRDTQVICETGACIDCKTAEEAEPCRGILGSVQCMLHFQRQRGVKGVKPLPGIVLNGIEAWMRRKTMRNKGLERLNHIVTISDALQYLVRKLPGLKDKPITTIGNFFTNIESASDQDILVFLKKRNLDPKKYFLVAGKKSYGKGFDLAVKAIQQLHSNFSEIKLLFVGKGSVSLPNHPSFVDCNPVSQEILIGLLQYSLALLIPGRCQEGLHRTMIDALSIGVPVICTEAGGPKEGVKDGINGRVLRCGDPVEIAGAMKDVLSWNKQELEQCSKEASKLFQSKWSDDTILAKWTALLINICGEDFRTDKHT